MNNSIIIIFAGILIAILIFIIDLKYIEIKILAEQYPDFISIQSQYDNCINKKLGTPCQIIKDKLDIINAKKPPLISSFLFWISDGISTMFNSLSPKNFGLLIVLIFALRIFIKY